MAALSIHELPLFYSGSNSPSSSRNVLYYPYANPSPVKGVLFGEFYRTSDRTAHPEFWKGREVYQNNLKNRFFVKDGVLDFNRTPIPQEDLEKSSADKKGDLFFGTLGVKSVDVICDFSDHISKGFQVAELLYKPASARALSPLGFATGLSLITGIHDVEGGGREFKEAFLNRDIPSLCFASLRTVKGALASIGGAVYIPARALTISAMIVASKVASSAALILGRVGDGIFTIVAFLGLINTAAKIYEQRKLCKGLNLILKDPQLSQEEKSVKALEYLQGLIGLSAEESEAIRFEVETDASTGALPEQARNQLIEQRLWTAIAQKEALIGRVLGERCVKQIATANRSKAEEVINGVGKVIFERKVINGIALGLSAIGTVVAIASFCFSSPVALLVLAAIGLATSLGWLSLDGYDLYQSFKEKDAGRFDQLLILISALVALVSISLIFVLSGGTAAVVAGCIIGAVWLSVNAYALYHLRASR